MKKFFTLIAAALTFTSSVMAIDNVPEEGLSFQVNFGMNVTNLSSTVVTDYGSLSSNPINGKLNAKVGANIGIRAEYMLPSCYGVYVNGGLLYTMKGARTSGHETVYDDSNPPQIVDEFDFTDVSRPGYLEIPIHVGYRYNFSENLGIYADFGPYFAMGINGKNRRMYDDHRKDDTSRFFNKDKVQRFDCGLGFRIGTEYANQHSLTIGVDWGLTDMYKDSYYRFLESTYPDFKLDAMKNFNFSLTYGFRFRK